ncbi:helix-turn-helix domain-containing protein [Comamonas composti]|uniref:helix-turn-helix domain-containing protein n=1 Tax=Comamonas composti TaxID=408558 RepID=UPI00146FA2FE|nr:AraC family transcriptional regulator [Comamonas composti]
MVQLLSPHGRASTHGLAVCDRIAYWEAQNASRLVGLKCSTHAEQGLLVSKLHYDLGLVQLTEIRGNQHVIERPRDMLKTHPKDSIFACLLLQGRAFFLQGEECMALNAGDVIVYSTDRCYLYGFATDMHQVVVECDATDLLGEACSRRPATAIRVDRFEAGSVQMAVELKSAVLGFLQHPSVDEVDSVSLRCRAALHMLVEKRPLEVEGNEAWRWRLQQAEIYIRDNLDRSDLDASEVAQALGISVRHLNRIFARNESSTSGWIWRQRVLRAEQEMQRHLGRSLSLGDLSLSLGFASQSHFSRVFRRHFHMSPGEYRQKLLSGKSA